jgi:ribosomal protein S12 methylthiotransferase
MMHIYLESLGCARNQVDSETMLAQLEGAGLRITQDPAEAEAIIVNTCSFIEAAANESIDTILALARYRQEGRCRKLIVTGCLPERYRDPIVGTLPEVDLFLGTGAYDRIVEAIQGRLPHQGCLLPDPDAIEVNRPASQKPLASHAAYLKIAEGCSRHCTYCIIPKLRGRQKSRPVATLLTEARTLIAKGARELTLVSQESTAYGRDLTPPLDLAHLLAQLAGLDSSVWIRWMYGHPESLTMEVLDTVAKYANLCAYVDLPVQHAAEGVLKRMGRPYTGPRLLALFERLRQRLPHVALRTTVLVGFPGETQADFEVLKQFIGQVRFDHLGVFTYSDADDLPSHGLGRHVSARLAQARMDELMAMQRDISAEKLARYLGQTLEVLIEERQEDGFWVGRTMYQAPEVDGVTFVRPSPQQSLKVGDAVKARIVESMDYDLIAEII